MNCREFPRKSLVVFAASFLSILASDGSARAALPAPPEKLEPWQMPWDKDVPGELSADGVISAPAGAAGPIVVRDGHFFSGARRLRFLGASIAFAGAFPSHEQADTIAIRLARFGINAVRFHHIDFFAWPNGIFADDLHERLSPEALDRLDYFVAALKKRGVYSDLNLHVSRSWSHTHKWPDADKLPDFDKMVDIFNADLMTAQKQYARDLLTHVNPYTKSRYADEPAVCFVEINNEDTLFLWGGESKLAELPPIYAGQLQAIWNQWLTKRYGPRDKLKAAWSAGIAPAGPELLHDGKFEGLGQPTGWNLEMHESAHMDASAGPSDAGGAAITLNITKVDDVSWHLQFNQAGLKLKRGHQYTLSFDARANDSVPADVGASQAHEPWQNLGLQETVSLGQGWKKFRLAFKATTDDENGRISFIVGHKPTSVVLRQISLHEGGQTSLEDGEDPAKGTVDRGGPRRAETTARTRDWYEFLQQTDEAFFVEMRRFLKEELAVNCPITGTIGLGILGTLSQTHTDFVDAHAYWDHPQFPRQQWDNRDWVIQNAPMVDDPAGAALWGLAATRVAGMPFTVTEYNHAAPNEWQAECVPFITALATAQDWDGVFLFDYIADQDYKKTHTQSYFDIEGNPQKMAALPLAARIFLSNEVSPLAIQHVVHPQHNTMLDTASQYYFTQWPFVRDTQNVAWADFLQHRFALSFTEPPRAPEVPALKRLTGPTLAWTSSGPNSGTGRFTFADARASIFVGFSAAEPVDAGALHIESMQTPFATLVLAPADMRQTLAKADRILLSAVAGGGSTGMKWQPDRKSVSDRWGNAPALVEVVQAKLSIKVEHAMKCYALTPNGKRGKAIPTTYEGGTVIVRTGDAPTLWYEFVKE